MNLLEVLENTGDKRENMFLSSDSSKWWFKMSGNENTLRDTTDFYQKLLFNEKCYWWFLLWTSINKSFKIKSCSF